MDRNQGTSLLQPRRGVASATPIERLSERVNIFLNTKRMHIPWGPMCVSYPDTSAHARTHAHINAQMWGPPYMRNELPEVFFPRFIEKRGGEGRGEEAP